MAEGVLLDQEALVDEKRAARFLSVSRRTLRNWRSRGGGPKYVRYSQRCIRYRIKDLLAWADQRTLKSTSDQRLIRTEI